MSNTVYSFRISDWSFLSVSSMDGNDPPSPALTSFLSSCPPFPSIAHLPLPPSVSSQQDRDDNLSVSLFSEKTSKGVQDSTDINYNKHTAERKEKINNINILSFSFIETLKDQVMWLSDFLLKENQEKHSKYKVGENEEQDNQGKYEIGEKEQEKEKVCSLEEIVENCLDYHIVASRSSNILPTESDLPTVCPSTGKEAKVQLSQLLPSLEKQLQTVMLKYFAYIAREGNFSLLYFTLYKLRNIIEIEEDAKARKLAYSQFFTVYVEFLKVLHLKQRDSDAMSSAKSSSAGLSEMTRQELKEIRMNNSQSEKDQEWEERGLPPFFEGIVLAVIIQGSRDVWSEIRKLNAKESGHLTKYLCCYIGKKGTYIPSTGLLSEEEKFHERFFFQPSVHILYINLVLVLNGNLEPQGISSRQTRNQPQLWRQYEGALLALISIMKEMHLFWRQQTTLNFSLDETERGIEPRYPLASFITLNHNYFFSADRNEINKNWPRILSVSPDGSPSLSIVAEVNKKPLSLSTSYNLAFSVIMKILHHPQLDVRRRAIEALTMIVGACHVEQIISIFDSVICRINSFHGNEDLNEGHEDNHNQLVWGSQISKGTMSSGSHDLEALLHFACEILILLKKQAYYSSEETKTDNAALSSCHFDQEGLRETESLAISVHKELLKRFTSIWRAIHCCLLSFHSTVRQGASNLLTKLSEISAVLHHQIFVYLHWFLQYQITNYDENTKKSIGRKENPIIDLSDQIQLMIYNNNKHWEGIEGSLLCFESIINSTVLQSIKLHNSSSDLSLKKLYLCQGLTDDLRDGEILEKLTKEEATINFLSPQSNILDLCSKLCLLLEYCLTIEQFEIQRISIQVVSAVARLLFWADSKDSRTKDTSNTAIEFVLMKKPIFTRQVIATIWRMLHDSSPLPCITVACNLTRVTIRHFRLLDLVLKNSVTVDNLYSLSSKLGNVGERIASEEFLINLIREIRLLSESHNSFKLTEILLNNMKLLEHLYETISELLIEHTNQGKLYPLMIELIISLRSLVLPQEEGRLLQDTLTDNRILVGLCWIQRLASQNPEIPETLHSMNLRIIKTIERGCKFSMLRDKPRIVYSLSNRPNSFSPKSGGSIIKETSMQRIDKNFCIAIIPILEPYVKMLSKENSIKMGITLCQWLTKTNDSRWKTLSLVLQNQCSIQIISPLLLACITQIEESPYDNTEENFSHEKSLFTDSICHQLGNFVECREECSLTHSHNLRKSASSVVYLIKIWTLAWRLDRNYKLMFLESFLKQISYYLRNFYFFIFEGELIVDDTNEDYERVSERNISLKEKESQEMEDDWDSWDEEEESTCKITDKELIVNSLRYFLNEIFEGEKSGKIGHLSAESRELLDFLKKVAMST